LKNFNALFSQKCVDPKIKEVLSEKLKKLSISNVSLNFDRCNQNDSFSQANFPASEDETIKSINH